MKTILNAAGLLAAATLASSLTADTVKVAADSDTRIVAEFDSSNEVQDVQIETRTFDGAWVLDEIETATAQEVIEEGADVASLLATGDCNGNGIADNVDIANGAEDRDRDGRLDVCERANGDMNLNGVVDVRDLYYWLGIQDSPFAYQGDIDGDGENSGGDIALILLNFGTAL
jgi:hypothetical protein